MKKTFFLLAVTFVISSCAKKETCTCKLNGTVTYTESSTDFQKVESDCESYADHANGPGTTVITICTVQ
ncbi:MAG: hypothetical protein ABI388_04035 [Bacteroidia bacterium]